MVEDQGTNVEPMPDDAELALLIKAGDISSLAPLYRRFFVPTRTMLRHKFPSLPPEDIEDIVVDTFLRIVRRRDFDASQASLKTYVYTQATFQAMTFRKRRRHIGGEQLPDEQAPAWTNGRSGFHTVARPDREEPSVSVMAALQQLSPTHQKLLLLHYYEGRPLSEIAKLRGCKEETVESQLSRARKALRQLLGEPPESNDRNS